MNKLEVQLARLATMSSAALRAEWRQLYKQPAPDMSADLLRRGIAFRLQEKALGGLPPSVQREIERLMREVARTGEAMTHPAFRIKPGTWLVRDWGGGSHHVLDTPAGGSGAAPNPSLLKLVAQAFAARAEMERGGSFDEVAARLSFGREYLADMLRTSYLSPGIIAAIAEGRQPRSLSRKQLVQTNRIPLAWHEQEKAFGFA